MDGTKETHESYGLVGVSRRTGDPGSLFGSSIRHHNYVALTIKRAELSRDLHRNWYFGHEALIEVEMSNTQFAELITTMNIGDGVPCTIRHIGYETMERPPDVQQQQIFEDEFKADMQKVGNKVSSAIKKAEALLNIKGSIKKADRQEIVSLLNSIAQDINLNMPFVQTQFNKAMDKTVSEMKGEIEAFVTNKITSLGIEAMRDQFPQIANEKGE
ncbi:MAG: hypothetical protein HQ580_16150 [Planctomycetes bacterium]|nr:hypothetical protein [Planctomycetota bacterium]